MPLASVAEFTSEKEEENVDLPSSSDEPSVHSASSVPIKGLKRSPYLSQMTQNANADLMEALSRPDGRRASQTTSSVDTDFFSLRRPQPKMQDAGTVWDGTSSILPGGQPRNVPGGHAVSGVLRGGSSSALRSAHHGAEGPDDGASELKKNSSVTFSKSTKQGSSLGLQGAVASAAAAVMDNEEITLAHQDVTAASANAANSAAAGRSRSSSCTEQYQQQKQEQGKNQFPFYFDTLSQDSHSISPSPSPQDTNVNSLQDPTSSPPTQPAKHPHHHNRTKSKSANTLQYYYQPALQCNTSSMTNINPHFRSSRNLTFREMLDEGDGKEGDLNVKRRNEQWKDFISNNSMFNENDDHDDDDDETTTNSSLSSGLKRTITPTNVSANHGPFQRMSKQHTLIGSDRGCVSAHDLEMFRRSASRMKMTNGMGGAVLSQQQQQSGTPMQCQNTRPGETLGATMLNRLSSMESGSDASRSVLSNGTNVVDANVSQPCAVDVAPANIPMASLANHNISSPLAQMMAKKFNMTTMPDNDGSRRTITPSLMGRKVHTVSAGLAYGSAGFRTDSNTRVSRFELLKSGGVSALSLSSGGSGTTGTNKNEEW